MAPTTQQQQERKKAYKVRRGQVVRVGVRISEKEQRDLGLPTPKKSKEFSGDRGESVELTEREALSMRHALEDGPALTDAEVNALVQQAEEMGTDNPDRKAIREAVASRQAISGPDWGRLPRSHEVQLMMNANRDHERAQRANGVRALGYQEVNPAALGAGGAPNAGRQPMDDDPDGNPNRDQGQQRQGEHTADNRRGQQQDGPKDNAPNEPKV
jgi:hypothetical protein